MKTRTILQVHNSYVDIGGEDIVVAREKSMLKEAGYNVIQHTVSNKDLDSISKKLKTAVALPYSYKQKRALKKVLERHKPDVVHVHNFLPILTPSIFYACNEVGIPVVLSVHNYRLLCSNGLLYRDSGVCEECISKKIGWPAIKNGCYQNSRIKTIFPVISNAVHSGINTWSRHISKVIFLTDFSRKIFMRSHINFKPSQVVVKPNFVEDRGYRYDKKDYFLFVGRLSEEKGILYIIEGCIKTKSRLKIAGQGPLEEAVRNYAAQYDFIEYYGFQNQEELRELYLHAKALITASQMYETFGLVITEAFSYGTPVIAPDFGAARHLVKEDYNGALYDKKDLDSMIKVLTHFKKDKTPLNKGARLSFEKEYSESKNLELLLQIYNF